jgi:hypothetical protein
MAVSWNERKFESHMPVMDRFAPSKAANRAKHPVLQALQFQKTGVYRKLPGEAHVTGYRPYECLVGG